MEQDVTSGWMPSFVLFQSLLIPPSGNETRSDMALSPGQERQDGSSLGKPGLRPSLLPARARGVLAHGGVSPLAPSVEGVSLTLRWNSSRLWELGQPLHSRLDIIIRNMERVRLCLRLSCP